jgi:hypothetical protein
MVRRNEMKSERSRLTYKYSPLHSFGRTGRITRNLEIPGAQVRFEHNTSRTPDALLLEVTCLVLKKFWIPLRLAKSVLLDMTHKNVTHLSNDRMSLLPFPFVSLPAIQIFDVQSVGFTVYLQFFGSPTWSYGRQTGHCTIR